VKASECWSEGSPLKSRRGTQANQLLFGKKDISLRRQSGGKGGGQPGFALHGSTGKAVSGGREKPVIVGRLLLGLASLPGGKKIYALSGVIIRGGRRKEEGFEEKEKGGGAGVTGVRELGKKGSWFSAFSRKKKNKKTKKGERPRTSWDGRVRRGGTGL